ncbi:MAG: protein kinase [Minicystis sp.]
MSVALSEGSVFGSRYRVVRRIAMGGMGAVYEVQHLETDRRLALKVMLPHIVQSAEMQARFRREARVAAQVESEHIVDVLDAGVDDATGMPFMVMELLRGEELSKALVRARRFDPADTLTVLHQASLALDKTHRSHIVHRDLEAREHLPHRARGRADPREGARLRHRQAPRRGRDARSGDAQPGHAALHGAGAVPGGPADSRRRPTSTRSG